VASVTFIQPVSMPSTVVIPSFISSPVIVPAIDIPSTVSTSVYYTVSSFSSIVIISYNDLPSTIPSSIAITIPTLPTVVPS
jgi:hypothetical protein